MHSLFFQCKSMISLTINVVTSGRNLPGMATLGSLGRHCMKWNGTLCIDFKENTNGCRGQLCVVMCVNQSLVSKWIVLKWKVFSLVDALLIMHSIVYTGRLLSRAIWNGITNYTTSSAEASVSRKREPHLVHAVCGFPKDFTQAILKKGQFGDDAWFHALSKTTDVIGKWTLTVCLVRSNPRRSCRLMRPRATTTMKVMDIIRVFHNK